EPFERPAASQRSLITTLRCLIWYSSMSIMAMSDVSILFRTPPEILVYILTDFIESPKNRALMDILFHKCELVGEMAAIVDLKKENYVASHHRIIELLRHCVEAGQLPANLDLECGAIMIRAMMAGLLENWLLQPDSFKIHKRTEILVETMLETLKYSPSLRVKTDQTE
ncbi:TetR family transcriptional regulator C-terminal domain-containing protein, partial [Providencia stuartii]|uniref:TetR family transcriptional regulator C-terminal domain-containing protein n=1 Tax=Providencia stuartii TaxID=588 RepID=UPI0039C5D2A4